LRLLLEEKQISINRQIVEALLVSCKPFYYGHIEIIADYLLMLADDDIYLQNKIGDFLIHQRRNDKWRRYKILAAVIAAILLCIAIFLLSR
jgi:hypothetical protein